MSEAETDSDLTLNRAGAEDEYPIPVSVSLPPESELAKYYGSPNLKYASRALASVSAKGKPAVPRGRRDLVLTIRELMLCGPKGAIVRNAELTNVSMVAASPPGSGVQDVLVHFRTEHDRQPEVWSLTVPESVPNFTRVLCMAAAALQRRRFDVLPIHDADATVPTLPGPDGGLRTQSSNLGESVGTFVDPSQPPPPPRADAAAAASPAASTGGGGGGRFGLLASFFPSKAKPASSGSVQSSPSPSPPLESSTLGGSQATSNIGSSAAPADDDDNDATTTAATNNNPAWELSLRSPLAESTTTVQTEATNPPPPPPPPPPKQGKRSTPRRKKQRVASPVSAGARSRARRTVAGLAALTPPSPRKSDDGPTSPTSSTNPFSPAAAGRGVVVGDPWRSAASPVNAGGARCTYCKHADLPVDALFCPRCGIRLPFTGDQQRVVSNRAPLLARLVFLKREMGIADKTNPFALAAGPGAGEPAAGGDEDEALLGLSREEQQALIKRQRLAIEALRRYVESQAKIAVEQSIRLDELQAAIADDLSSVSDTTLFLGDNSSGSESNSVVDRRHSHGQPNQSTDQLLRPPSVRGGAPANQEQLKELAALREYTKQLTDGSLIERLEKRARGLEKEVIKYRAWAKRKRRDERGRTKTMRAWVDQQARRGFSSQPAEGKAPDDKADDAASRDGSKAEKDALLPLGPPQPVRSRFGSEGQPPPPSPPKHVPGGHPTLQSYAGRQTEGGSDCTSRHGAGGLPTRSDRQQRSRSLSCEQEDDDDDDGFPPYRSPSGGSRRPQGYSLGAGLGLFGTGEPRRAGSPANNRTLSPPRFGEAGQQQSRPARKAEASGAHSDRRSQHQHSQQQQRRLREEQLASAQRQQDLAEQQERLAAEQCWQHDGRADADLRGQQHGRQQLLQQPQPQPQQQQQQQQQHHQRRLYQQDGGNPSPHRHQQQQQHQQRQQEGSNPSLQSQPQQHRQHQQYPHRRQQEGSNPSLQSQPQQQQQHQQQQHQQYRHHRQQEGSNPSPQSQPSPAAPAEAAGWSLAAASDRQLLNEQRRRQQQQQQASAEPSSRGKAAKQRRRSPVRDDAPPSHWAPGLDRAKTDRQVLLENVEKELRSSVQDEAEPAPAICRTASVQFRRSKSLQGTVLGGDNAPSSMASEDSRSRGNDDGSSGGDKGKVRAAEKGRRGRRGSSATSDFAVVVGVMSPGERRRSKGFSLASTTTTTATADLQSSADLGDSGRNHSSRLPRRDAAPSAGHNPPAPAGRQPSDILGRLTRWSASPLPPDQKHPHSSRHHAAAAHDHAHAPAPVMYSRGQPLVTPQPPPVPAANPYLAAGMTGTGSYKYASLAQYDRP
ncbi:hypothetical protein DIPPA_22237 [Diplonema papillatum]|nr:hypothetical protein DIPPA_22237 [Diplonema papillatum]